MTSKITPRDLRRETSLSAVGINRDNAGDVNELDAVFCQVLWGNADERCQVSAGGVTRDEHRPRISTVVGNMRL